MNTLCSFLFLIINAVAVIPTHFYLILLSLNINPFSTWPIFSSLPITLPHHPPSNVHRQSHHRHPNRRRNNNRRIGKSPLPEHHHEHRPRHNHRRNNNNNTAADGGVILPRIIFVAEEDEDNENRSGDVIGLEQVVINSYPKFPFSKSKDSDNSSCAICLCDYKDNEMLRMMPDCRHLFHLYCLDAWLRLNGSCPVCRNSPLPTPLSTPLAEVVPLSQYSADRRR